MTMMKHREDNMARWSGVRPAHRGEQIYFSGTAANSTVILYTVPAGKILFITNYWYGSMCSVAAMTSYLGIFDAVPAVKYNLAYELRASAGSVMMGMSLHFPIEVLAGYSIRLYTSLDAGRNYGGCCGYIEDA